MAPWDPAGRGLVGGDKWGPPASWAWRAVRRPPVTHIKMSPQCLHCCAVSMSYRTVQCETRAPCLSRPAQIYLGPLFELPEVRMHFIYALFTIGASVDTALVLVRQAPPGTGITNAEYKLAMYALTTDRPGCLEYQVHGTRRTCRTGQVYHGRMVLPS